VIVHVEAAWFPAHPRVQPRGWCSGLVCEQKEVSWEYCSSE
jgi:hypothetical protein